MGSRFEEVRELDSLLCCRSQSAGFELPSFAPDLRRCFEQPEKRLVLLSYGAAGMQSGLGAQTRRK